MSKYKAFLFDLNGTMVNDMHYHITAWHKIFTSLGAQLTLAEMKAECYGKNSEVIERVMPGRFSDAEKKRMSIDKETKYQEEFRPHLKLIDGLEDFLIYAHEEGIRMGIGSAAIMYNIDFVLDGLQIRKYFNALVSADDVQMSKPHPETFLKCAHLLGVPPDQCLVFEDAPKGAEAALNAGMDCVVITTMHEEHEFPYKNIIRFIENYNEPIL